jgi:integrase
MSPRKRDARKRGWPPNLYERNGYFSWRDPTTGKEHGIGRNKQAAIVQAVEANVHVQGLTAKSRLVDRLTGVADRTFGAWMDEYEKQVKGRDLAENTLKTYATLHKLARELVGDDLAIERVETLHITAAIDTVTERGNNRTAQALRSRLKEVFRSAMAKGWIKANPVDVTDKVSVTVNRARLPWDVFWQLYRFTDVTWLRNAMAIAILSAQRREDIVVAMFKDVHDEAWWCQQIKTGNRVCLPMALRLDAFGMSLEDVIKQCRQTGVLSKHLVHQTRKRGNSPVGQKIWKDRLSKVFTLELERMQKETGGIDWEGRDPPTFHEIRSLSERMYAEQGNVKTQDLLGHKDPRTTALYHDSRGMDWVRVEVGTAKK